MAAPPSAYCQICNFSTRATAKLGTSWPVCVHTLFFPLPWKNSDIPDITRQQLLSLSQREAASHKRLYSRARPALRPGMAAASLSLG